MVAMAAHQISIGRHLNLALLSEKFICNRTLATERAREREREGIGCLGLVGFVMPLSSPL